MKTKTESNQTVYNVWCASCGMVWQPTFRTPLWWKAKQRADKGYLDAYCASAEECGCVEKVHKPNAPYRVFGYDSMCCDYDIACSTFIKAVKIYKKASRSGDVVFITGVSDLVRNKLDGFGM